MKLEQIVNKIFFIRGLKVMLDTDLAEMYQVETKRLNEQVKRNKDRFPEDFMFQLTKEEWENLKSQNATSSNWSQNATSSQKHRSTLPYAFTEQGVAMLSGVLKSKVAVEVNISIMRAFVQMRTLINENKELKAKIESLEKKYDQQFKVVFDAIKKLIQQPAEPKRKAIGFKQYKK